MIRSIVAILLLFTSCAAPTSDAPPLPSWNESPARRAILAFVARVTDERGPAFVPEDERVATFDNDGTLWAEKPLYFQLLFAFDRIRTLAADHPEWRTTQPFKAVLEDDVEALVAGGKEAILEILAASHAGMTCDEFVPLVESWLENARHARFDRPYTDLVYQPMLELLEYLRAHGFKVFIVSGGGIDFMRPWVDEVYGVPAERVVGSMLGVEYTVRADGPAIVRKPTVDFIDDREEKVVAIHRFIGRRPILAVGNSDGDFQMLEWTTAGDGARLGMIVHHTDGDREWAYDRDSAVGKLDRALDEASARGWVLIDMARDWKTVFP